MTSVTRVCSVEECERKVLCKELCNAHYQRRWSGLPLNEKPIRPYKQAPICTTGSCREKAVARGMCGMHYQRDAYGTDANAPRKVPTGGKWGRWLKNKNGYVYRNQNSRDGRLQQFQHRYVMEQYLSRELLPHENVHHKNGQRDDNRPENLELWSVSQPPGQRVEDKMAWAKEFLADYGYKVVKSE